MRLAVHRPLQLLFRKPWPVSAVIAPGIDHTEPVEEESSPFYSSASFYPARLSETLENRYQLATKLGHGSRSTVWLARDLNRWSWQDERYVVVKIRADDPTALKTSDHETSIMQHISRVHTRHPGRSFTRQLIDSFLIQDKHHCLVFEPLREPLWMYAQRFDNGLIPSWLIKIMLQMILQSLDHLHSECHMVHTDLKLGNILIKMEDSSLLAEAARQEYETPLPQKRCDDGRIIYLPRNDYGHPARTLGLVCIADFDMAVYGDMGQDGCISAEVHRAPEVVLDAGYTYSADIWSLGTMLWDMVQGKTLFAAVDPALGNEYSDVDHLSYMTGLLGPPPDSLLAWGKRTSLFYDENGRLKNPTSVPADMSFGSTIDTIQGKDKAMFIEFARRMLRWRPEEWSTAKELLQDPWLHYKQVT